MVPRADHSTVVCEGKKLVARRDQKKYVPRILGHEVVPSFIVYDHSAPIGFIQYYSLETSLPEGVQIDNGLLQEYLPKSVAGMDLFIAQQGMRRQGLGVTLIHQFIDSFLRGFSAIVVDPEINNIGAIRCYEKAGFKQTKFSEDPNHLLLMLERSPNQRILDQTMLQTAKTLLQEHFSTELAIESFVFLSEPERRNIVLRLSVQSNSAVVPKYVILKQSLLEQTDEGDEEAYARFARDWAGLEFLSKVPQRYHNVPKFYGASKELRFILIEDLGTVHVSLVDALTLPDKDNAISALNRFMQALGSFHAATFGHMKEYGTILGKINDKADAVNGEIDCTLKELLPTLVSANESLGLSVTPQLLREAENIITEVLSPGPFTVLTHGDICPDNVFDHIGKDLQLIDFEWAFVRSALLDGTYLRMSMPTCWCAKAIPNEVIAPLEAMYRQELMQSIPAASDDVMYSAAYTTACGFWVLQQTLPLLHGIIFQERIGPSGPVPKDSLWRPGNNTVRPRFLSRLQSFADMASQHDLFPHLREMANKMLVITKKKWPEVSPLEFYPAFVVTNS
jgi:ribosomal protein S18 acetylase RimI-like enzyme